MSKACLVSIAILSHDCFHLARVSQSEALRNRSTVVEHIRHEAGDLENDKPGADSSGEITERILQVRGRLSQAKPWEVGRKDVIAVAEKRNEVSILHATRRKSMEKKYCWLVSRIGM